MDEVRAWQARPLDAVYPIVYLDALVVRSRASGAVQNKHVYLALGVNQMGEKEILGLWMAENEGAKFWLSVMTELKNRGSHDIFIACTDGLKGFPEAIEAVYPETQVQLCIVHQVRHSLRYVSWKQRKEVADDLNLPTQPIPPPISKPQPAKLKPHHVIIEFVDPPVNGGHWYVITGHQVIYEIDLNSVRCNCSNFKKGREHHSKKDLARYCPQLYLYSRDCG